MGLESSILVGMVAAWFAVSLWSRLYGGMLGVLLSATVGCWGVWVMMHGQRLYVLGMGRPVAPGAFYTLVSMLVVLNAVTALQSWRRTSPG